MRHAGGHRWETPLAGRPAPLSPMEVFGRKVREARELIAAGASLRQAAVAVDMLASDLDLALWRDLGVGNPRRSADPFQRGAS